MSLLLAGLSKRYGRGASAVEAVRALDLAVAEGEIVALLGSSGCGKTSCLRMIAGFETVTEGSITLAGRRIERLPPAARGVAMAFEGYALYPPLSVAENIGFGLARRRSRAEAARTVREIAALLEIEDILDRRPGGLSGGQQQRASLARALARDADLHLLDEPMGQLEPQLRAVLRGRVKALIKQRGYTALLVTHDQTEANAMADRIAVMESGELQQYGTPDALRERPANLFVATFLGEPPMNVLAAEPAGDGVRLGGAAGITIATPGITLPAGDIALGVRPHRLRLGEGALSGTIASNQWLGDQAHVVIDFAGQLLVAVADRRVPARMGEAIAFGFAPRDVHLFDRASGAALGHGLAAP